jgi:2-polyprenyl-3-methyl-5-hydroxy-6-metoxy-1,4-benzoquinol methylase
MPSSSRIFIPYVCKYIENNQPKSILDIGIGFGKYGFLAREYIDIAHQRYDKSTWTTIIDGIEIFPNYVKELQKIIYNNIYIGDVVEQLKLVNEYDLIIFIDVIEHLTKEKGFEALRIIQQKSKFAIVATPIRMQPQEPENGNEAERHITQWSKKDLKQFGEVKEIEKTSNGIYYLQIKR